MTGAQSNKQVNPLTAFLPPFKDVTELAKEMVFDPLARLDWKNISPGKREQYADEIKYRYGPNSQHVEIAADIQRLIWGGLHARNPIRPEQNQFITRILNEKDVKSFLGRNAPSSAHGMIISGLSGTGKTRLLTNAIRVILPRQVIIHEKNQEYGWSSLTQITYLHVDAPATNNRGALYEKILEAIDSILGTNYAVALLRLKTEQQMVTTLKVLCSHRVGVLIIDEAQVVNLVDNRWVKEFTDFFKHLMNLGVPLILAGNPLAFEGIADGHQDTSRFCEGGWHEIVRAESAKEKWWLKQVVPTIMSCSLCEVVPAVSEVNALAFEPSAGIPRHFQIIWKYANIRALRRAGSVVPVVMKVHDIEHAIANPAVRKMINISDQITSGNTIKLTDVPTQRAKRPRPFQSQTPQAPDLALAAEKAREAARAKEVREKERAEKEARLKAQLANDDLRLLTDAAADKEAGNAFDWNTALGTGKWDSKN
jgi:hypothetical protein